MSHKLIIAPLGPNHDRAGFRCGIEALDHYPRRQAKHDVKRRISRVFVATRPDSPEKVIGYYTLSALSIELIRMPAKLARKLPKHPAPAALIGRLAVHETHQRYGVGKMLLADAVKRTLAVGDQIAIHALVVDAINERAERFYRGYGFIRLGNEGTHLFLPLKSIQS